jgi:hypothetical protein
MTIQIRSYQSMPTRPCHLGLALQDDSVFADFDMDEEGCFYLVRISFDGYGCCYPDKTAELVKISSDQSARLIQYIKHSDLAHPELSEIIQSYLYAVRKTIWEDALKHHGLLSAN